MVVFLDICHDYSVVGINEINPKVDIIHKGTITLFTLAQFHLHLLALADVTDKYKVGNLPLIGNGTSI